MEYPNKPGAVKKSFSFMRWIIVFFVVLCICVAIYFLFNRYHGNIDSREAEKTVVNEHSKSENDTIKLKQYHASCYDVEYLNNLQSFMDLYLNFYKGKSLNAGLLVLHDTDLNDKYLEQAIQVLRDLTNNNNLISENELKKSFAIMKVEVLRKYAQTKFQHSLLLRGLFNAITFYKQGQAALAAGGIEEKMERAQEAIKKDKINEAYAYIISIIEPEYTNIIDPWLEKVRCFTKTEEILKETRKYILSEAYSSKFIKTCR